MGLFGNEQSEVQWLRERVKFLEEQLIMLAEPAAASRLLPRPERKDPTGKTKTPWRLLEDRPQQTRSEAAAGGSEASAATARAFDPRQP